MNERFYIYLLLMAGVTYLIRMLPLVLLRRRINSRFIRSFLYYVPYATLTAMTFPAVLYATDNMISAACGLIVAVALSLRGKSLLTVACFACLTVLALELLLLLI